MKKLNLKTHTNPECPITISIFNRMNRSTKSILPPNFKESTIVQIGWNGYWRKQCEQLTDYSKSKDCAIIMSLVYDPVAKRLIPANVSTK